MSNDVILDRLDKLTQAILNLDAKVQGLEAKVQGLDAKVQGLEASIQSQIAEVRDDIAGVRAVDLIIKETVDNIHERLTVVERSLEYLMHKSQEHDKELFHLKRKA